MRDFKTRDDLVEKVHRTVGGRRLLLVTEFGSGLYGTSGADSDTDLCAVFLPTAEEILMGETEFALTSNSDHRALGLGDMDIVAWSLHRFLNLLGKCDMSALEVLFAGQDKNTCLLSSATMTWVFNSREALIGTENASPLGTVRANLGPYTPDDNDHSLVYQGVIDALSDLPGDARLWNEVDRLDALTAHPDIRFSAKVNETFVFDDDALAVILEDNRPPRTSLFIEIRKHKTDLQTTVEGLLTHCRSILKKKERDKARKRVSDELQAKNVYHAVRILDQLIELAGTGEMRFPRVISPLLRRIRNNDLAEDELKREIAFFFNSGVEAAASLPFPEERCLATVRQIITQTHRDAITNISENAHVD